MCKIAFFGLKSGQDLKNRATHPHQEFLGVPPRAIDPLTPSVAKITDTVYCDLKKTVHGDTFDRLLEFLISEVIKEFVIEVMMHYGNLRAQLKDILTALVSRVLSKPFKYIRHQ